MNNNLSAATESQSPVIQLSGVTKRYGRTLALDNVSLKVPPGVVFAILGENGAGKTSLIRILTGFLKPNAGAATVLGHDCATKSKAIRQSIGYVSDAPALYDWMRPDEIGWFTSAFYPEGFLTRYNELIAQFGVPTHTKIKNLSKGQRAKVALSLATAHDPKLLILDEPTSGLDPMVRRQFMESMVDRASTGCTVFLSSHQIAEVERVADWIAILHRGKLQVVQPLDVLRANTLIITATLDHSDAVAPLPPGQVLSESKTGRQVRWIATNLADGWQDELKRNEGIVHLQSTPASLEEIFVAICHENQAIAKSTSFGQVQTPQVQEVAT